jgi:hypothetical protein
LEDLRLRGLVALHRGTTRYPLAERVRVIPVAALARETVDTLFPLRRTGGGRKGSLNLPQRRARPKRGVA